MKKLTFFNLPVLANFPAPWRVQTSFTGSSRRKRSSALARDDAIADKSATSERNSKFTCDVIARRQAYYSVFLLFVLVVLAHFSPRSVYAASDNLYFLHTDHLGSTRAVTDQDGNIVSRYDYYPYGSLREVGPQGGPTSVERLYTSQIRDGDTSLYFYNARYYDPSLGIFISPDTVQGPNRYAYVANNPINMVDPSGNQEMYLPPIWKQSGEAEESPQERLMGKLWVASEKQHIIVDPSSDEALADFVEKAINKIVTPEIEDLYKKGQKDAAQQLVLERTVQYVWRRTKLGLYLYNEPVPLGSTIKWGTACLENSILTEVILTTIDPSIESNVTVGLVKTRPTEIESLRNSIFNLPKKKYGHAWVRAEIGDEYYFGDPTKLGKVLPQSKEETFYRGRQILWFADYIPWFYPPPLIFKDFQE